MKHENLPPKGYVQAAPVMEYDDDIDESVVTITLATGSFPATIRAMNLIREDSGGPSWPPEASPRIAARWQPYLAEIEAALAGLADDKPAPEDHEAREAIVRDGWSYIFSELYTFCNGEHQVVMAIAARTPAHGLASEFLNDFFDGWLAYEDEGFNPKSQPAQESGEGSP